MAPIAGVRVTLVVDRPEAVYSGMVPGFVAGDYAARELAVDVVPLARRARARVVLARAISLDANARRIELEGRPPIAYDVASLDVGATVRGLDLPGVREHALATRPIARLVEQLEARSPGCPSDRASRSSGAAPRVSSSRSRWTRGCARPAARPRSISFPRAPSCSRTTARGCGGSCAARSTRARSAYTPV